MACVHPASTCRGGLPLGVLSHGSGHPLLHPAHPRLTPSAVAIALHLVGARPVKEGTGRIARFELVPLEEMGGRPRVDVLCK